MAQGTLPAKGYIDTPANNSLLSGKGVVNGWLLDGSGVSKVEVVVDGKTIGTAKYGISRPDVAKAFPQYKNVNSGYQYTLDTTLLTNGKHSLSVKETGKTGNTTVLNSLTIYVNNSQLEIKVNKIIADNLTPSMSEFEKIYTLHKYVVDHVKYDTDNYNKNTIPYSDYTAEGALLNGTAVCEGYSKAFEILLDKAGIKNWYITGTAIGPRGWEGHAWNMVRLNGNYYNVDTTWDDVEDWHYFLVSSKKISTDHRSSTTLPITDTKYDNVTFLEDPLLITSKGMYETGYNGSDKLNVVFVDKTGKISYPFNNVKIAKDDTIYQTIIKNNYLFYLLQGEDGGLKIKRVRLDGKEDTLLAGDVWNQIWKMTDNQLIFVDDKSDLGLGAELHILNLKDQKDKIIATGMSNPQLYNNLLFYFKEELPSNGTAPYYSLNKVDLNNPVVKQLAKFSSFGIVDHYENHILTCSIRDNSTGKFKTVEVKVD